jgi:hypothetical protein
MALKRVFIHIGLAKTGTKSIQFALARRRGKLARSGWLYPVEGTTNNRSGHHAFAWSVQGATHEHPGLKRFDIAAFKTAVGAAKNENLIISSEGLSGLSRDEGSIHRLLGHFPDHEPTVIAYAREQADVVNSRYGEILSDLTYPGPIDAFAEHLQESDILDYPRFFRNWAQILGPRLTVRPFDLAEFKGGDLVDDFAGLLEIAPILTPYPSEHRNIGYNFLQAAMLQGLVEHLSQGQQRWERHSNLYRQLRRTMADILSDPALQEGDSYWGLSAERTQSLRSRFRESNAAFFSAALGKPFEFSAARRLRACNAIGYGDLPLALRQRAEALLQQTFAGVSE